MKRLAFYNHARCFNYRDRALLSGLPTAKRYVGGYWGNGRKLAPAAASQRHSPAPQS